MTDLTALLETAHDAHRRDQAAKAEQARKAAADWLRQVRTAAVRETRDRIGLETEPTGWESSDDEELARAGVVVHPITIADHGEELALGFRLRSYTEGGPRLTIVTRSEIEETWVSSRLEIATLADLPATISDAIAAAEAYDEALAELENDPDLAAREEAEARYVVEGDTLEEILARTIVELVAAWETRDA